MDQPLQLCYPVKTLGGKELLPEGSFLTPDTMENLVRSADHRNYATAPLTAHGTIARDLERICKSLSYGRIFSDPLRRKDIFNTMQRVELVKPLLEIYDHFKTHDPYTYRHMLAVLALSLLLA